MSKDKKNLRFVRLLVVVQAIIFLAFCYSSCGEGNEPVLPPATGKSSEVLAIVSNELYNGKTGKAIDSVFRQVQYGLPQGEYEFNLSTVPPQAFSGGLKSHLNVLITKISAEDKPGIYFRHDVWARSQLVATAVAASDEALYELLLSNEERLRQYIHQWDCKRILKLYDKNNKAISVLEEDHGLHLTVPSDFVLTVNDSSFVWLRRETKETDMGILIHYRPYRDTSQFNWLNIVAANDSVTRNRVPGPAEGSYMKTSVEYPIQDKQVRVDGNYAIELRGLWDLHGDFMGGPFISYTSLDSTRSRLVTVQGFVYAPKFDKRDYVKRLEAVLSSLRFPG